LPAIHAKVCRAQLQDTGIMPIDFSFTAACSALSKGGIIHERTNSVDPPGIDEVALERIAREEGARDRRESP